MNPVDGASRVTPAVDGPASFDDLTRGLQRDFVSFSPAQRRVARLILEEPERCAVSTIGQLARSASADAATVSRFVRRLGLGGYAELIALCRERLREETRVLARFDRLADAPTGDVRARAASEDAAAIARTFAHIDPAKWDAAVAALCEARSVYVMGLRARYAVSYLLWFLLAELRERVELLTLDVGRLPNRVRDLGPADAFVGISIRPYSADVLATFAFAAGRGACTIALTDGMLSPLARDARIAFVVEATGVSHWRSSTAFVSLAEALAAAAGARLGASARDLLACQDALLDEFASFARRTDDAP